MEKQVLSSKKKYQPVITKLRRENYRLREHSKALSRHLEEAKRILERYKDGIKYYREELAARKNCE